MLHVSHNIKPNRAFCVYTTVIVELTLGSLLCLGSLSLSCLSCIQLLVVGGPGCLVVGVSLGLSLSRGGSSCLLVGVLAGPGSSSGGSSRRPIHRSLWSSIHLSSLVGTAAQTQITESRK